MHNCNTWRAAKNLWINHNGWRGLYIGFLPNALLQTMLFLPFLIFGKHLATYQPGEVLIIEERITSDYPVE